MAQASDFSVGLMAKLARSFSQEGWTPEELEKLSQDSVGIKDFRDVRRGFAHVESIRFGVDRSRLREVVDYYILHHPHDGKCNLVRYHDFLILDGNVLFLWLWDSEIKTGHDFLNQVGELPKRPLDATILEFLLDHQRLIPDRWKTRENSCFILKIIFWGTIYQDNAGRQFVRYLQWDTTRWESHFMNLDNTFWENCVALCEG